MTSTELGNPTSAIGLFEQIDIKKKFESLLGENTGSFLATVMSIIGSSELLKNADPQSVYNVAITAASMRLPINPNLGFAYIIPYQKKKKVDGGWENDGPPIAQFQMGYKGFKQLAFRSEQFVYLNATDVRDGEIKNYDRLSGEITFDWIQNTDERLKKGIIGYVSSFKLRSGFSSNLYMTVGELQAHGKKYSQSYKKGYGLWVDDLEAMSLKTVTKLNLSKNAPLSIDMQKAIIADQGIVKSIDGLDLVDGVDYIDHASVAPEASNDMDEGLLEDWKSQLKNCKTLDELSALHKQNKPTDSQVLDLFTQRKNELNQKIQS